MMKNDERRGEIRKNSFFLKKKKLKEVRKRKKKDELEGEKT